MGKKSTPQPSRHKSRQRRKEMFAELATVKQEMINQQAELDRNHRRRIIMEDSEESVQLDVLEHQNKNLDMICETVHKLLSKNKVSAKNAFSVPLIDLQQLPDFNQSLENQHAWKRLSSTLQSDYKIYGYRVDAIHSITYNILNTMSRRQQDVEAPLEKQSQAANPTSQQPMLKISEQTSGGQHLQKKIQNLNLIELELVMRMDPILERTKRQFDLLGQSSMMIDTLPLDEMLCLQLVRKNQGKQKYPTWGSYDDLWKAEDPLMAFIQLSAFRAEARETLEGIMPSAYFDIKMEDQDMEYLFLQEKQNHFDGNYEFGGYLNSKGRRPIDKEIYIKYPLFKDQRDAVQDAQRWLQEINRNFKGKKHIDSNNINSNDDDNSFIHRINLEDMIDFQDQEEQQRDNVFKPDRNKLEHHEDIQDRFLVAVKLHNPLDLNILTFLREKVSSGAKENLSASKEAQVDVRRQMVSIMQAKRKIKQQIHRRSTFSNIYKNYCHEQQISPALCFLTILHLANEHDLTLKEIDESNFYVY